MRLSKEQNKKYNDYIIGCIDANGYDVEQPKTDKEKINTFFKIFNKEYEWQINHDGEFKALIDYLQGLGGCLSIAFNNYDILELAKDYGSISNNATEKEEQKILDNYWLFMANKLMQLNKKAG